MDSQFYVDVLRNARGLGQLGRKMGQEFVGRIPAGLAATGELMLTGDMDKAADVANDAFAQWKYEPDSQEAKDYGAGLGRGVNWAIDKAKQVPGAEQGARYAGEKWEDFTNWSPAMAALLVGGVEAADAAVGGAGGTVKTVAKTGLKSAEEIAEEAAKHAARGGGEETAARVNALRNPTLRETATNVDVTDEDFMAALRQNMSERDISLLREGDVEKLRDMFYEAQALDPGVLAPAALAGRAKRGWYTGSGQALREVFGDDTERFVALLAATSPRTSVENNLTNALAIWRDWNKLGRPSDPAAIDQLLDAAVQRGAFAAEDKSSVLGAWRANSRRALGDDFNQPLEDVQAFLSGPKVESFRRNLLGDLNEVTNDAWQATGTGQDPDVFAGRSIPAAEKRARGIPIANKKTGEKGETFGTAGPGYLGTSAAVRETARRLTEQTGETWTPAEVQETLWSLTKAAWEKADASNASIRDTLAGLTHSEVSDVPDFSGLLPTGKYGQLLEEAGYGPQLETLRRKAPGQAPEGRPADIRIEGGLEPFTRQLASNYLQRRLPGELRDVRGRSAHGASDVGGRLYERGSGALGRHDLDPKLRENVAATHIPNEALVAALRRHELSAPRMLELAQTPEAANFFREQILRAKQNLGSEGASVHVYSPEEYQQMQLFMPETGKGAGVALKPGSSPERGKDLVSLFNQSRASGQRGFAFPSLMLGMQQGARTLDAFDTVLPNIYSLGGFREAARLPWNPKYAPEGWDETAMRRFNLGQPDVSFMALPPWLPDRFGRFRPPESPVVPIAPRRYGEAGARADALRRTPKQAEAEQSRILAGERGDRELRELAETTGGRVPMNAKERARALREFRRQRKQSTEANENGNGT